MPSGGVKVWSFSSFNLGARWSAWSIPRPDRFTYGKDPVPIAQEAGWAGGPVWTGAENLAPSTRNRSPVRLACGESLYRLSYPGPRNIKCNNNNNNNNNNI